MSVNDASSENAHDDARDLIFAPAAVDVPELECEDEETKSVAGMLRPIYAAGSCADTSRQLGKRVGCHPRTVRKANVLLRGTYGARFVEEPIKLEGTNAVIAVARRIVPETGPGVRPHSRILSDVMIVVRVGTLTLKAITDEARASATRELPQRPKSRTRKRRERLQRLPPLALEDGVPRRIAERHTLDGWRDVKKILTEPDYHRHADEARRAARELAESEAGCAPALFRDLFKRAKSGRLFGEEMRADAERVRLAELAERMRDPDFDPGTTCSSPKSVKNADKTAPPRRARVVPAATSTGPPRTADPNAAARFLERLNARQTALGRVEIEPDEIPY